MSHKGIEAVRKIVSDAQEILPKPNYLSFDGYQMDDHGLFQTVTKGTGEDRTTEQIFISGPFEIIGRVRDPRGEGWARLLRWCDDDDRVHIYSVTDAELHGDPSVLCATLASRGLKIAMGKMRAALIRYLNEVEVDSRVTIVTRTGWHDIASAKVFAIPNMTIGHIPNETVIVEGAVTTPFETSGMLADWKKGVGSLISGHSRAVFAVSIGFAGPLLGLLDIEGGGFNFFGQSSRGKTTLAEAAASVWGKGASPGFVRSWRSTANALEATAAMHTDSLLVLDELGVVDPRDANSAAYQLAVGSGKGRAARDGSLRQSLTWRTMVLSTGEIRIADKLLEGSQRARAGQQIRLIDLPADVGRGFGAFDHGGASDDPKVLADAIKAASRSYYGTAGPEFVRRIFADGIDKSVDIIRAAIDAFRNANAPKGADGQVLRGCDRFGLVAAAGELAREFGVVPFSEGEVLDAARRCLRDWLNSRGGMEAGEVQAAISQVRLFIEQHGDSRFEPLSAPPDRPVINRAGWRRGDGGDREWLIPPETWKAEVAAGQDPVLVARVLADRGMLKRAKDGFQYVERIQGRLMRAYVVTSRIVAEPLDE